jgi:ABC-type glutathione transport system ATPase component
MPSPSSPLLEIRGLRVRFGAQEVLRGVDLDVAPGEIVGVIGETGSGKTTLARSVVGLVRPSAGAIRFEATDLVGLGDGRRRRAFRRSGAIQLVFQDPLRSLDPGVRIEQTVTEGLAVRRRLSGRSRSSASEESCSSGSRGTSPAASASGSPWRARWSRGRG